MAYDHVVKHELERRLRRPRKRPCCNDVNNLRYAPWLNNSFDKVTLRCKHCKTLHFRAKMENGHYDTRHWKQAARDAAKRKFARTKQKAYSMVNGVLRPKAFHG